MRRFNEKTMSDSERERARQKVKAEAQKQAAEKRAESYRLCEKLTENFWKDFWNGAELSILVSRVEFALQNSGYERWKEEFFDVIGEKIMEIPDQFIHNREKLSGNEPDLNMDNLNDIRLNFNGIFVTPKQYQILCKNAKAQTLSPEDVIILCRKLAEIMPEFANFKEEHSIQLYVATKSTNEAYALFGLTFETLTESSLKQAYRRLAQMYHPDKNKEAYASAIVEKVQKYHKYLKSELRRKVA